MVVWPKQFWELSHTWPQKSIWNSHTLEHQLIFSLQPSFYSLCMLEPHLSQRPTTLIHITNYWLITNMRLSGKPTLEISHKVLLSHQNSNLWSTLCFLMISTRDYQWLNWKLIHGTTSHYSVNNKLLLNLLRELKLYLNNWSRKDLPKRRIEEINSEKYLIKITKNKKKI